ncbi:Cellulose synthase catalytic subunit [UDP-forming] [compost metagenome]
MRNRKIVDFEATIVFSQGRTVGTEFAPMTLQQQSDLVRLTFSRADSWAGNWGSGEPDSPLSALRKVSCIGLGGMLALLRQAALRRT